MILTLYKSILTFLFLIIIASGVKAQRTENPPVVKEGIQVKRSYLIKQIQSSDSTMVFKQDVDVDGEPNYVGTDKDKSSVQFFGKEDKLKKVIFTFKFTIDQNVNLLQYKRMAYFASLMNGKAGVSWLEQCAAEFVKNPQKSL